MPRPEADAAALTQEQIQQQIEKDHGYTTPVAAPVSTTPTKENKIERLPKEKPPKQPKPRKQKELKKLLELQNTVYTDPYQLQRKFAEPYHYHSGVVHKTRDQLSEFGLLFEFLTKGKFSK